MPEVHFKKCYWYKGRFTYQFADDGSKSSKHSCYTSSVHMNQDLPRDLGALHLISHGGISLFQRVKKYFVGNITLRLEGVTASNLVILELLFPKLVAAQRSDFFGVGKV